MNVRKTGQGYIVDGRPMTAERFANLYPNYQPPEVAAVQDTATGDPAALLSVRPLSGFAALVAAHRADNAAKSKDSEPERAKATTAPKRGPLAGDILTSTGPQPVGAAANPSVSAAERKAIADMQADLGERINRKVVSTVTAEQIEAADALVARKDAIAAAKVSA